MTELPTIKSQRAYLLGEQYGSIKERATQVLAKYLDYPGLITFNDTDTTHIPHPE